MNKTVELILALIAASAALGTVGSVIVRALSWAMTRLIREELNPQISKLTSEFAAMRSAYEEGQRSQTVSNEELHESLGHLRETMAHIDERLSDVEIAQARLEERMAKAGGSSPL